MDKLLKLDKAGDEKLINEVKKSLSLKLDDKVFLFSGNDCFVIKKIQKPSIADRFKDLSNIAEKRFKNNNLQEDVVDEAIKWARK